MASMVAGSKQSGHSCALAMGANMVKVLVVAVAMAAEEAKKDGKEVATTPKVSA